MMKAIIIIVYVLYIVVNLFIFIRDESNPWRLPLSSRGLVNGTEKSSTRCIICVCNVFL